MIFVPKPTAMLKLRQHLQYYDCYTYTCTTLSRNTGTVCIEYECTKGTYISGRSGIQQHDLDVKTDSNIIIVPSPTIIRWLRLRVHAQQYHVYVRFLYQHQWRNDYCANLNSNTILHLHQQQYDYYAYTYMYVLVQQYGTAVGTPV